MPYVVLVVSLNFSILDVCTSGIRLLPENRDRDGGGAEEEEGFVELTVHGAATWRGDLATRHFRSLMRLRVIPHYEMKIVAMTRVQHIMKRTGVGRRRRRDGPQQPRNTRLKSTKIPSLDFVDSLIACRHFIL